jgi:hypothetical protein
MQRRSRGEEKKRRSAKKSEKYREKKRKLWGCKNQCTYYKETENVMITKDFHAVPAHP